MTRNLLAQLITYINLAVVIIVGWFLFAPLDLTEIHNDPYPVWPASVMPGDTIYYEVEFTKYINYRVKTTKTIICTNGFYRSLPNAVTEAPVGHHIIDAETVIPDDMPAGECYIQFNSDAHINPIRVEELDSRTESFNII